MSCTHFATNLCMSSKLTGPRRHSLVPEAVLTAPRSNDRYPSPNQSRNIGENLKRIAASHWVMATAAYVAVSEAKTNIVEPVARLSSWLFPEKTTKSNQITSDIQSQQTPRTDQVDQVSKQMADVFLKLRELENSIADKPML